MKKISTVAATASRNISQPKLTIGLDLGDRNSWYCVLDEAGQIQVEQRVRTTAKGLREVFGGMDGWPALSKLFFFVYGASAVGAPSFRVLCERVGDTDLNFRQTIGGVRLRGAHPCKKRKDGGLQWC